MAGYARLFSQVYDASLARGERAGLRELRRGVLSTASGDVLEIGAGTGLNVALYPDSVANLTLSEPEPSMVAKLSARANASPLSTTVVRAPAERLPFPDSCFDHVVSTLVLCTVEDPAAAVAELLRVLRPAGDLLLLEHVRGNGAQARWQDRLHQPWKLLGYGCYCNRDTASTLALAGLDTAQLREARWRGMPPLVTPLLVGRLPRP
jgi:SAM-dependent methyltransferase